MQSFLIHTVLYNSVTFAGSMVIAVNTRFLLSEYLEGYGYFIEECFRRITTLHPEHQFIFIFDRPYLPRFLYAHNVRAVVAAPAARHPLLWKWWYDVKIPAILKKYKADVFVSPDGHGSLHTRVPQCIVIHDLSFLHYPAFMKKGHVKYYKRYTPQIIKKAKKIVTVSAFSRQDIIRQYGTDAAKIDVVGSAARHIFQPMDTGKKQQVKELFTEGKEYFLYTGAIHPRKNLVNLLKGFSKFKKRQQSNFKLVLAGRLAWKYESFLEDLKSYKYRADVILTGYLPEAELASLTAAAYALVYPSLFEGFGVPVLEAMQSGVPVITSAGTAMEEVAAGAACYADATDPTAIGEQMMQVYKDEDLRAQMIAKGLERAALFDWDQTARQLWQSICNSAT